MTQSFSDPLNILSSSLQQLIEQSNQIQLENNVKVCICIGITKIQFEEITHELHEYNIFQIIDDQFLTIKKIQQKNKQFYMINIPYTDYTNLENIQNYKTSIIILYLLLKKQLPQIHYLVKINTQNDYLYEQELTNNLTLFIIASEQKVNQIMKKDKIIKQLNNQEFLHYIRKSSFVQEEKHYFQMSASQYIQEMVDQFLQNQKIDKQLKTIYQSIDFCSQLPRSNTNFDSTFENFIATLQNSFSNIDDSKSLDFLIRLKEKLKIQAIRLDQSLRQLNQVENKSIEDFCETYNLKIKDISFSLDLDCQRLRQLQEEYSIILDQNIVEWESIALKDIKEIVSYVSKYINKNETEKKFDLDLLLSKFQIPFQIKQKAKVGFIFGLTKVGKSTTTSIIENPENIVRDLIDYQIQYKKIDQNTKFSVDNSGLSNNQRFVERLQLWDIELFDCPGLNDTNEQFRIINMYNISQHLNQCKNPIIIIIIDSSEKSNFFNNFKETINNLNVLSQNLLTQINFKPLFILTKIEIYDDKGIQRSFIDSLNDNLNEITTRNDFIKYLDEIKVFFKAFQDGRVIYFPHARQEFNLQAFRDKIKTTLEKIFQEQKNFEFQVQLDFKKQNEKLFLELKETIENRITITTDYFFRKIFTRIVLEKNESLDCKLQKIQQLRQILENTQTKSVSEQFEIIENWTKYNYNLMTLNLNRFKQFDKVLPIFDIQFKTLFDKYYSNLIRIEEQINLILTSAKNKKIGKTLALVLLASQLPEVAIMGLVLQVEIYMLKNAQPTNADNQSNSKSNFFWFLQTSESEQQQQFNKQILQQDPQVLQ